MATAKREQDFITLTRQETRAFWDAYNALRVRQAEWQAQDYGNTLDAGTGENEGIVAADVGAVIFATMDAVKAVMDAGHATNVTNLL